MTQDEIIEMARQAGYFLYDLTETHGKKTVETDEDDEWAQLAALIKLAVAQEREACAKVCETGGIGAKYQGDVYAQAIRARGET